MSIFSAIANAEHTFCAWFEKIWTKIYGAVPKIEQIADATLSYVGPALQLILAAIGEPAVAAVVGKVVEEIQTDLHVASGLIYDFGANPQAASILDSIQSRLNDLLTAGHVTDPKTVANIQKVITTIKVLTKALLSALGTQPAPAAA